MGKPLSWTAKDMDERFGTEPEAIIEPLKKKTLTRQVEEMVDKKIRLSGLCGEMLATFQLNIERGYIVTSNDEGKLNLDRIIANWRKQYDEIEKDT